MKIKVLYIDNTYTFGGAIISLRYLLKGLNKRKYSPIVVTGQPSKYLKDNFQEYQYYKIKLKLPWVHNSIYKRITSLPIFRIKIFLKIAVIIRTLYWFLFVDSIIAYRYYKIGKRHKVKIVHLNNIMGGQFPGIMAAKLLGVPCVAHLRDFENVSTSTRFYARLINHHIAISNSIKDNLLELGVAPEKITVIYDAVDLDEYDINCDVRILKEEFAVVNGQPLFGIFGRIIDWKGIKEFIIASCEVFRKDTEAKAFIIGGISDGNESYLTEIKELVDRSGMSKNIIFTGYRADIPAMMKLMDVVVLASIVPEPFGMVVIEAMAMGKPVVATRAGGPLDSVVDGETGLLIPIKDTKQMANAIVKLLENPTLAGKMGRNGRKRAEEIFCKERYANQVEEVYASLLGSTLS